MPVQEAGQASKEASAELAEPLTFLPSYPEGAVDLPRGQAHAVSQPGTPQQSSETSQISMEDPLIESAQPKTDHSRTRQQAAAGSLGKLHVTIPTEGLVEQYTQYPQDTGSPEYQSQPAFSAATEQKAQQRKGVALVRPHKSLPAHAFKAALSKTQRAAPDSRQLTKAWQEVEGSSEPESVLEALRKENNCDSKGPLCTEELLLRSLITKAGSLLKEAGKWGFDTLELAEVSLPPAKAVCLHKQAVLPVWYSLASNSTNPVQNTYT